VNSFREALNAELQSLRQDVLHSNFARELGHLDHQQIARVWSQYLHYARRFPDWMLRLAGFFEAFPLAKSALEENWLEETGRGQSEQSHVHKLTLFVRAWGGDEQAPAGPSVSQWIQDVEQMLKRVETLAGPRQSKDLKHLANLGFALGWIGPATEELTSAQYTIFLQGLRRHAHMTQLEASALEFFELHLEADPLHADALWTSIDVLLNAATTDSSRDDLQAHVRLGARQGLEAEKRFWEGVWIETSISSSTRSLKGPA